MKPIWDIYQPINAGYTAFSHITDYCALCGIAVGGFFKSITDKDKNIISVLQKWLRN